MMWGNHPNGVSNGLIDITNILSKGDGDTTLCLRRHFMRTVYAPPDVPEFATNISSEINDSIRVLNFTRSDDDIIIAEIGSHTTDEDNS
jgi:hypothetical protein